MLNVRNFVYGNGLNARAFDGELVARDFDDDLEARGFDEFEVRDIEDDLKARNVEDDLKARDLDDVLEARGLVKRGKGGKGGGGSRSQHHCGYKTCTKSKDKCTEHYWECSGEGTVTHSSQKVLIGKACESNCRDTTDGQLYKCGRSKCLNIPYLVTYICVSQNSPMNAEHPSSTNSPRNVLPYLASYFGRLRLLLVEQLVLVLSI